MGLALGEEVACAEIVESDDARLTAGNEILVRMRDGNRVKFVCLASVGARFEERLRVCLSQVPVRNLLFLAHADVFIIVEGRDREGVDASHSLCLGRYTLLCLKVPAQD